MTALIQLQRLRGTGMIHKLLRKLFIVEDDTWFSAGDLEIYSGLIDIALYTDDRDHRQEALTHIRSMACSYINKGNPLGYMLIADWNVLQLQSDNALVNYLRAANAGIPQAQKKIYDYKLNADSNAGSCILLAEAYFLNGNDQEGISYLKRCIDLGCTSAESVLELHKNGTERMMTSFYEIHSYISDFQWRLSESISLNYGDLDDLHQEKTRNFCRGFTIARGAMTTVDMDRHTVTIAHSYMERVLIKVEETTTKEVQLLIKEWSDMETTIRYLLDGIKTTIDLSECRTELAQAIFDILGGFLYGLTGDINRKTNDVYEYVPHRKEANGTESEVWRRLEYPTA